MNIEITKLFDTDLLKNLYVQYRTFTLIMAIVFFIMQLLIIYSKKKDQIKWVNNEKKLLILKFIIIPMIVGLILYSTNNSITIDSSYFVNIISLACLILNFSIVIGMLSYKKGAAIFIANLIKFNYIIIALCIFFFSNIGRLYLSDIILSSICILILVDFRRLLLILTDNSFSKKFEKSNSNSNSRGDQPVNDFDDLFKPRKNQLNALKEYLTSSKEPYLTIAINAGWGEGKTSFINALKKDLEENNNGKFIYIDPNLDTSYESMIKQFLQQIDVILYSEKIYSGKGSKIEGYFKSILSIVGDSPNGVLSNLFKFFSNTSNEDYVFLKKEVDKDIEMITTSPDSNVKLYVIVDDLDRCSENIIIDTIKFLHSLLSIKGICTFFLVDYDILAEKGINREYLSKFFNEQIDLAKINFSDIYEKYFVENLVYLNDLLDESSDIRLIRNLDEFKRHQLFKINGYLDRFITSYMQEESNLNYIRTDSKNLEADETKLTIKNSELKLNLLKENINSLEYKLSNPRNIKRFYRELERTIGFINQQWFKNDYRNNSDYSDEKWIDIACNVVFAKTFFENEYQDIVINGYFKPIDIYKPLPYLYTHIFGISKTNDEPISVITNFIITNLFEEENATNWPTKQLVEKQINEGFIELENIPYALELAKWMTGDKLKGFKSIWESIEKIEDLSIKKNMLLKAFEIMSEAFRTGIESVFLVENKLFEMLKTNYSLFNEQDILLLSKEINQTTFSLLYKLKNQFDNIRSIIFHWNVDVTVIKNPPFTITSLEEFYYFINYDCLSDYINQGIWSGGEITSLTILKELINLLCQFQTKKIPHIGREIQYFEEKCYLTINTLTELQNLETFADSKIQVRQSSLLEIYDDNLINKIDLDSKLKELTARANNRLNGKLERRVFADFSNVCKYIEDNKLFVDNEIIDLLYDCYHTLDKYYSNEIYEESFWYYSKIRIEKISVTQRKN